MRPVDNFSAPRLARLSISAARGGVCSGVAIHPVGDLSALAGRTLNAGGCGHGTVFAAGVRGRLPRPRREGFFRGAAESCERASSKDPPQTIEIDTCLPRCASWPSSA